MISAKEKNKKLLDVDTDDTTANIDKNEVIHQCTSKKAQCKVADRPS